MKLSVKHFRAKRLKIEEPHGRVEVFIRHAAGTLETTLSGPLTITVVYPMSKQNADKKTEEGE